MDLEVDKEVEKEVENEVDQDVDKEVNKELDKKVDEEVGEEMDEENPFALNPDILAPTPHIPCHKECCPVSNPIILSHEASPPPPEISTFSTN